MAMHSAWQSFPPEFVLNLLKGGRAWDKKTGPGKPVWSFRSVALLCLLDLLHLNIYLGSMDPVADARGRFHSIDTDNSGFIEIEELMSGLADYGLPDGEIEQLFWKIE